MHEEFEALEQKLKKLEHAYHEKDDELYNMKVRVSVITIYGLNASHTVMTVR